MKNHTQTLSSLDTITANAQGTVRARCLLYIVRNASFLPLIHALAIFLNLSSYPFPPPPSFSFLVLFLFSLFSDNNVVSCHHGCSVSASIKPVFPSENMQAHAPVLRDSRGRPHGPRCQDPHSEGLQGLRLLQAREPRCSVTVHGQFGKRNPRVLQKTSIRERQGWSP